MAKGLKYLLPILLLVLGCDSLSKIAGAWFPEEEYDPNADYSCTMICPDDTPSENQDHPPQSWVDCEIGDECGRCESDDDCPVPGGRGVLVCEYDEVDEINVCSCSCDLDD